MAQRDLGYGAIDMNNTIKFWIDYAGGMDVAWVVLIALAGTQLFKMLLKAFSISNADAVRPVPYVIGSIAGLAMVGFTSRGAMVGMACGMLSSLMFFAALTWLERDGSPSYQIKIANWLSMR